MASQLVREGHQVLLICGSYSNGVTGLTGDFKNGQRRGQIDGIDLLEFRLSYSNKDGFVRRSWTFLKFAMKSMKIAIFEEADLVFATTTPLTAALPGLAAKWFRRRPFVFEVRDLWPEIPKAMGVIKNKPVLWAMGFLEWCAYKSADRIIGLSPGIVDGVVRFGKNPEQVAMVPNGCDIGLFQDNIEPWRPASVSNDQFLAVFTGTHGLANGLHAVIDAAIELKKRSISNITLLLVGDGMQKQELIERVAAERLCDIVLFHDPIPKTKLTGLLAAADAGMQILHNVPAFYYGTSPNKFFDYLAAGLPVLTNYPGWVADLVTEHNCGIATTPEDSESFADGLQLLAENKNKFEGRSLDLAKLKFDRNKLSQQWSEFVLGARKT